jgi:hypothetical protein
VTSAGGLPAGGLPPSPARAGRNRRDFLFTALGTGAGAMLAGCSSPVSAPPKADPALAADPTLTPAAGTGVGAGAGATPADSSLAGSAARFFGPLLVPQPAKAFGLKQADVLSSDDKRFSQLVRVYYRAGVTNGESIYDDPPTYGGTQLLLATKSKPPQELFMRYYVRFPTDFDFVKGGKLPGFYGVDVKNGKLAPGDGGFAARLMWRKKGLGGVAAYLPNAPGHLTTIAKNMWTWRPGEWTCVELGLRLNIAGHSDGALSVWIDGNLVHQEPQVLFRLSDRPRIGGLVFSTYFGGGDGSWDPPFDQNADFAAFAVGPARIGQIKGPRSS